MSIDNYELVGSYNNQRFPNIDAERSINLWEYIDPKGKKPHSLISTSGLRDTGLIFTGSTGGFRAEFVLNQFEYLVVGQDIWRRDQNNVLIKLNPLPLPKNEGYVGVDANNNPNGSQILFVDGEKGYIWDTGTSSFVYDVRTIDTAFPLAPVDVCFLDGFLVVAHGGTNQFQLSGLNDAYSWGPVANTFTASSVTSELTVLTSYAVGQTFQVSTSGTLPAPLVAGVTYFAIPVDATHIKVASSYTNAIAGIFIPLTTNGAPVNTITNVTTGGGPGQLQQGQINSHPGHIVACRTLHRRLFLFSSNYTEVWENAGIGGNLPFRRNNALLMENGTPSVGSIVASFDKLMFLAQDNDGLGSVMEVSGTEAMPVSNRALDFQLAQYAQAGQVADSRGIFIKENGIIFYRLNFTAANHTFVYNVTLSNPQTEEGKLWHEEEVLDGDRHPAQTHGYFFGNNYFGHYRLPILYQVDSSFVTNAGEIIPRIRIGRAYVPKTYNRTRTDRFMVDIIQGLSDVTMLDQDLALLAETGDVILTESGLDLLVNEAGTQIFNPDDHVIYLSISKDGGVTYNYRQAGVIGGTGRRKTRTVWRKLGVIPRGQAFVPKIEFYGNISLIILGAAWAFEVMPE